MHRRTTPDGIDTGAQAFLIHVDKQWQIEPARGLIAKRDHLAKLPRRIDVQQREGRFCRRKSLAGKMQKNRGVFADRIEQYRVLEAGACLAQYVDAFRLKRVEMIHVCPAGVSL